MLAGAENAARATADDENATRQDNVEQGSEWAERYRSATRVQDERERGEETNSENGYSGSVPERREEEEAAQPESGLI